MGDYIDKSKHKWLYGFVLSPIELAPTIKINYTVTESPYAANEFEYIANMLPASKQYFFNTNTNSIYNINGPPKKKKYAQAINQCK